MTVVTSKEFATRPARYYNLAVNEKVAIKRGKNMFHLTCTNGYHTNGYDELLEPDEDFYSAITKEELLKGIHEDLEKFFATK